MKKLLIYSILIAYIGISCKKQDRTTIVFGKVTNEINQPIQGVNMALYGEKGILASRSTKLKNAITDANGEYTITVEIPKEYHSGSVDCLWYDNPILDKLYTENGGVLYFNGNETRDCCPLIVGQKSQYDFGLVRKK